jgi:hypothetical protein
MSFLKNIHSLDDLQLLARKRLPRQLASDNGNGADGSQAHASPDCPIAPHGAAPKPIPVGNPP